MFKREGGKKIENRKDKLFKKFNLKGKGEGVLIGQCKYYIYWESTIMMLSISPLIQNYSYPVS